MNVPTHIRYTNLPTVLALSKGNKNLYIESQPFQQILTDSYQMLNLPASSRIRGDLTIQLLRNCYFYNFKAKMVNYQQVAMQDSSIKSSSAAMSSSNPTGFKYFDLKA